MSEAPAPSMTALSADDPRGVGRFEFLTRLGQGRASTVYLARARSSRRPVAVKLMHEVLAADAQFVESFLDEALAAELLRHAHIVPVLEVGVDGDALFTVMDYIEGDTLAALAAVAVRIRRSIPLGVVLRVALDALRGLEAAHAFRNADGVAAPVAHRDVSAQNILVGVDGVARVSDFGIASAERAAGIARQKPSRGRATFRVPSALAVEAADPRVDVLAMGATLWESIAQCKMFPEHERYEHAARGPRAAYRNLRDLLPSVPAGLDAVVRKAVAHDPARRFASAADFAAALEDATRDALATRAQVGAFVASVAAQRLRREREVVRCAPAAPAPREAPTPPEAPAPEALTTDGVANDVTPDDDGDALDALIDALDAHGDVATSVRLRLVPPAPEAFIVDEPVFDVEAIERMSMEHPELLDAPSVPPTAGYDVLAHLGSDDLAWNSALLLRANLDRELADAPTEKALDDNDGPPREPLWGDDLAAPPLPSAIATLALAAEPAAEPTAPPTSRLVTWCPPMRVMGDAPNMPGLHLDPAIAAAIAEPLPSDGVTATDDAQALPAAPTSEADEAAAHSLPPLDFEPAIAALPAGEAPVRDVESAGSAAVEHGFLFDDGPRHLARYPALSSSIDFDPYNTREVGLAVLAGLSFVFLYALTRAF